MQTPSEPLAQVPLHPAAIVPSQAAEGLPAPSQCAFASAVSANRPVATYRHGASAAQGRSAIASQRTPKRPAMRAPRAPRQGRRCCRTALSARSECPSGPSSPQHAPARQSIRTTRERSFRDGGGASRAPRQAAQREAYLTRGWRSRHEPGRRRFNIQAARWSHKRGAFERQSGVAENPVCPLRAGSCRPMRELGWKHSCPSKFPAHAKAESDTRGKPWPLGQQGAWPSLSALTPKGVPEAPRSYPSALGARQNRGPPRPTWLIER